MEAALYEPGLGYYRNDVLPWGGDGDYITAPQVHPALGVSIARMAVELDGSLGRPDPFVAVEIGSGNGALAAAFLDAVRRSAPNLWRRLRFVSVERGPAARAAQTWPATPGAGVEVVESLEELPDRFEGLVYGNELLDAFPVERVRGVDASFEQLFVDCRDGRLREIGLQPAATELRRYLERNQIELGAGQVADICLGIEPWIDALSARLSAGGVLMVDYGHDTPALFGPSRQHGTLVAQQRFVLSDEILERPGDQDLTAHVDWGNLRRLGIEREFMWAGECSLGVFLIGMGATEQLPGQEVAARMALRHLLVSEIAEAHRVVFLHRDIPGQAPVFGRSRLEPERGDSD